MTASLGMSGHNKNGHSAKGEVAVLVCLCG